MQCFHCGREVKETTHTQKDYKVDYYLLHTGRTEWSFFKSPNEDAPTFQYLKLTDPTDIFSCIQCYSQTEIRKRLDNDFNGLRSMLDSRRDEETGRNSIPEADGS